MKKRIICLLALLCAALMLVPAVLPSLSAADVRRTHILDSLMPNHLPRAAGKETTTATPDPADGMPFMPGSEEGQRARSTQRDGQGTPAPAEERLSIGVALLVVGLALLSLVLTVIYVFGKGRRHRR